MKQKIQDGVLLLFGQDIVEVFLSLLLAFCFEDKNCLICIYLEVPVHWNCILCLRPGARKAHPVLSEVFSLMTLLDVF